MNTVATYPITEDLNACTGCAACAAACPGRAISMQQDAEGFLRPQINAAVCNDCRICINKCPVNRKSPPEDPQREGLKRGKPLSVFAAWHLDEATRRESSSGGVFTALADIILAQGGVVAGAAFDDSLVVRHILVDTPTDLRHLRGSKYVQSEVSPALYHQIRYLLKRGRPVLFSGTPCQVAAIYSFLGKPYENLFCCDIVCHGVPSPILFERYVQDNLEKGEQLVKISFRDKTTGWKNYSVRWHLFNGGSKLFAMSTDPYMAAFLRNYALRPSCYICKFANTIRPGDLTIGDFWGVFEKYPEYDRENQGTSLVLVNTNKGQALLDACRQSIFLGPADLDTAISGNLALNCPVHRPPERDIFYRDFGALSFPALIRKYRLHPPSLPRNIVRSLKHRVKWVIQALIKRK